MIKEKRASQIFYKAIHQQQLLAGISNTAPINVYVRFRAYNMIWQLKQDYTGNNRPAYVSKKQYEADLASIVKLEESIIQGGSDEDRAGKAIAEAKEYLDIIVGSRVRVKDQNRVY